MLNPLDLVTLVCVLVAALHLGLLGLFGFNTAEWMLGDHTTTAYQIVGASALWQLSRQRFV
jgi:uncharacterized membrane protein YuzA (DUF378 family)